MIITSKGHCIAAGNATRDVEIKTNVGEKQSTLAKFSIAAGKDGDGNPVYLDCEAWNSHAEIARGINKGDPVYVAGIIKISHSKDGEREYRTLRADFIALYGGYGGNAPVPEYVRADSFNELADDEEVPF